MTTTCASALTMATLVPRPSDEYGSTQASPNAMSAVSAESQAPLPTAIIGVTTERRWDAGASPSGVYFVRLTSGAQTATRKMLLMR